MKNGEKEETCSQRCGNRAAGQKEVLVADSEKSEDVTELFKLLLLNMRRKIQANKNQLFNLVV